MDREQASYLYKLMPNVKWVHDYLLNWIFTTDSEKDTSCCALMHGVCVCMCVCAQSCLTLCNPMDCSLPGSSVHGILQAKIQE